MAEASATEGMGASASTLENAPAENGGPAPVAGQKRPAEIIDLCDDDQESPKGKRKKKKQKKSKSRKGSGASVPESLEEGETAESNTSSNPSRPDSAASENAPAVPPGGWNTGVSSGLRISFGAKADKAPSKPALDPTESKEEAPTASTSSPVDDWQWPLHSLISFQKPPRKDDTTTARFSRWYWALKEANKTREDIRDPALVKEAWGVWLRRHPEMNERWIASAERDIGSVLNPNTFPAFVERLSKQPPEPPKEEEKEQTTGLKVKGQAAAQRAEKEAAAKQAKGEAASQRAEQQAAAKRAKEEAAAQRTQQEAAAPLEKQSDAASPPEEGEALSPSQEANGTTLSPEELRYLQTYFPGVNPRDPFCVSCAEYGHYQTECQPCSVCTSWTHRSYQCHTLWRCERCDATGHAKDTCKAKLAAAPEEKSACTFCQLPHNERQCPLLSQSYFFDPSRARKIKALVPSCYHCGARGHFGTQCPSNPQRLPDDLPSPAETWTMQNLLRYIDVDAEDYGIEGAAQTPSNNGDAPPTHAPRNHIFFEEADDEEDDNEPFLRPPVKKGQQQQQGQMSFAAPGRTMFSGAPGMNGSLPPLPLGPPPPLPPPASSLPPLPAGPPPPSRGQRRNPSGFRGRGGGGGGGGGGAKRGGGRGGRGRGK